MDPEVTSRLAKVISGLSEKIQVLVATLDSILFDDLKKSTRAKKVICLKCRDSSSPEPFAQVESISGD